MSKCSGAVHDGCDPLGCYVVLEMNSEWDGWIVRASFDTEEEAIALSDQLGNERCCVAVLRLLRSEMHYAPRTGCVCDDEYWGKF